MTQYIDKDALVAEIEKRRKEAESNCGGYKSYDEHRCDYCAVRFYEKFLEIINALEVKEIDDELQGLEKEVAEDYVGLINKKRVPIELKGELKAKFKNEFNTLWQTVNGIDFANVAKPIIERICLNFATWGFYNLSKIGDIKGNKEIDSIEIAQKGE